MSESGKATGKAASDHEGGVLDETSVRRRLLTAAMSVFARRGYAATTVREIVGTAGVTKPVLYYYFGSKEGLYLELLRAAVAKGEAAIEQSLSSGSTATERLLSLLDRIFALMLEHLDVVRLMYAIYYGPPQGAPFFDFDAFHKRFDDAVRGLILEGQQSGEFRRGSLDDMALALSGAINACTELNLCHGDRAVSRETVRRVARVVLEGIMVRDVKDLEANRT